MQVAESVLDGSDGVHPYGGFGDLGDLGSGRGFWRRQRGIGLGVGDGVDERGAEEEGGKESREEDHFDGLLEGKIKRRTSYWDE